ncbi:tetratricopeptide repeat protein [Synechococcus sp. MIT S9508]|uniref:tetratricopeptide repeat protein n=1 Tax=Synechococcus sp. MIT S9508 TaxID=1801629 RepID=UPI0007BB2C30|nr:tetratricopeptide repeat protein [Synechococcus sp. MIT S9508]KZR90053.1 lipoprotein NlpI [Synechococcus sp. MIT S9508]
MSTIQNQADPKQALIEWCEKYTSILKTADVDLDRVKLVEDNWDTRFLFIATHVYIMRISKDGNFDKVSPRFCLPLYANLVLNTRDILIKLGVEKDKALSFVPNLHVRLYDYLIYIVGALNGYQDSDLDQELMASWYSTTAEDLVDHEIYLDSDPQNLDQFIKRGNARRASEDYKGAIEDYSKAIELNPADSTIYVYRGISHELLEDYGSANKDYTLAISYDPTNTHALRFRAFNKLTMNDDKEGALEDYNKAIYIDPNDYELYNRRAVAHMPSRGIDDCSVLDCSNAINDFLKAIELEPEKGSSLGLLSAYERRADLFLKDNRIIEAIDDYDNAIQICVSKRLLTKRGNAKQSIGELNAACQDWRNVLKVEPSKHESDEKIKEDIQPAIDSLNKYCLADILSLESSEQREIANDLKICGDQKADSGDLQGAIVEYTKSIDIDPLFWRAYNNRGNTFARAGDLDAAYADFSKSIEICPVTYYSYHNMAKWKLQADEYVDVIKYSNMAIAIEPNPFLGEAYSFRALAKSYTEDFKGGECDIRRALKICPDDPRYVAMISLIKSLQHEFESARSYLLQALELDPLDITVVRIAGLVEWNEGNAEVGRSYWEKGLAMGDQRCDHLLNRYVGTMSDEDLNSMIDDIGGNDNLQTMIDWAEKNQKDTHDDFVQQFSEAVDGRDLERTRNLLRQLQVMCDEADWRSPESGEERQLTSRETSQLMDLAGGEHDYNALIKWASIHLSKDEINNFDRIIDSGNYSRIKIEILNLLRMKNDC